MSRRALLSDSLLAQVRTYFGLQQEDLATFLGITRQAVANIEAGRRGISGRVLQRLNPLATQVALGLAAVLGPAETPPAPVALLPEPLEQRRAYCVWKAGQLRYELRAYPAKATVAQRWQRALPALLAGLPPANPDPAAATETERTRQWLLRRPTTLSPADQTHYHLLRLRAEALETEAAALATLLAAGQETGGAGG